MKFKVSFLLLTVLFLSGAFVDTADARMLAPNPTASITIGGQASQTVLTGQNIPNVQWKSTNGASFETRMTVNNPSLCNGIKDGQVWNQGKSANGSFALGNAPKNREGCVINFVYEVTNQVGKKVVDRATLRYTAPAATSNMTPTEPTTSSLITNPSSSGTVLSNLIPAVAPNITSRTENPKSWKVDEGKEKGVFEIDVYIKSDKSIVIEEDVATDINWWNENKNIGGFVSSIQYGQGDRGVGKKGTVNGYVKSNLEKIEGGKAESSKWILRAGEEGKFTIHMEYLPEESNSFLMELAGFKYQMYNSNVGGDNKLIYRIGGGRTPTVFVNSTVPSSVSDVKVKVTSPIKGNIISAGGAITVNWTAENVGSDKEFVVYLEGAYGDKVDNLSVRLDSSSRSHSLVLPYSYTQGIHKVVVAVNNKGVDTLKNAVLFKSDNFTITSSSVPVTPTTPTTPNLTNDQKLKAVEGVFGKNSELYRIVELLIALKII